MVEFEVSSLKKYLSQFERDVSQAKAPAPSGDISQLASFPPNPNPTKNVSMRTNLPPPNVHQRPEIMNRLPPPPPPAVRQTIPTSGNNNLNYSYS